MVYYSGTGNTKAMAEAVAEGAEAVIGPGVELKIAQETSVDDLITANAIAFGSPEYLYYMDGTLKTLIDRAWLQRNQLQEKVFAAFASGGIDGVKARESIENCLSYFKPKKICEGVSVAGKPTEEQIKACRKLGMTLAEQLRK